MCYNGDIGCESGRAVVKPRTIHSFFKKKGGDSMNEFFHAMYFSFNFWFVSLPACLLAMFMIGRYGVRLSERGSIVSYGHPRFILGLTASIFAIINTVLIIAESRSGIRQWFLNCLDSSEDPIIAVLLAAFATYVVLPVMVLFMFVGLGEYSFEQKYLRVEELQDELYGEEPQEITRRTEKDDFDVLIEIIEKNTKDE